MSPGPPGGCGEMMRMGLAGHCWAYDGARMNIPVKNRQAPPTRIISFISISIRNEKFPVFPQEPQAVRPMIGASKRIINAISRRISGLAGRGLDIIGHLYRHGCGLMFSYRHAFHAGSHAD